MLPLAGSWTLDSFSRHLDGLDLFHGAEPGMPAFRDYRRWAFESAAADLALRQAGRSLADVLGREPRADQVRRLAAARRAAERSSRSRAGSRRTPARGSSSTPRPSWDDELLAALAATGAVESVDFKGAYKGTPVDVADRSRALPARRRDVPRGVARGSRPDGPRGRRGAAPVPRPDHLGRADPRRRRHRGAAVPAADDQRQAVADRDAGRSCCARTSGAPSAASSATAAGSPSWASGAARSSTSRRSSTAASRTTSRRRATTGRTSRRTGCRRARCPPDIEPTGFRRRS